MPHRESHASLNCSPLRRSEEEKGGPQHPVSFTEAWEWGCGQDRAHGRTKVACRLRAKGRRPGQAQEAATMSGLSEAWTVTAWALLEGPAQRGLICKCATGVVLRPGISSSPLLTGSQGSGSAHSREVVCPWIWKAVRSRRAGWRLGMKRAPCPELGVWPFQRPVECDCQPGWEAVCFPVGLILFAHSPPLALALLVCGTKKAPSESV